MSIEQIKRFGGLKKQSPFKKSYYRTYEASPNFLINIGALGVSTSDTASEFIDIETAKTESKKFLPLSNIRISNNSSVNIYFYPNQKSEAFVISAGTIVGFDAQSLGGGLRSFKITNSSATTSVTANQIQVELWKEAIEIDGAFRSLHKQIAKLIGFHKSPM